MPEKNKAPAKSVGIWIRVSTEDQARGESPEHHERRAKMYAESKDWQVREVYHLEAVSGKSVMGHSETQRMLGHVKSGRISGLIFSKLARLARNTRELLDFADIFRDHNADLISLQESIDTTTPAGRLFYTMIAAMAQWEREEISSRVAAAVPIRAKLGKPTGGQAPFGYQWVEKKLLPDPKEAPIRKLMYDLFLQHKRRKTVARLLNEAGHRTRNGSKFSDTTVERLLRDPTAKGLRRANYTRSLGNKRNWELKPQTDWVITEVDPIVSKEIWTLCNAFLDEAKGNGKRPARKTVYLFSGVTFCACGEKMYVPFQSPNYVCRKCRSRIAMTDLEGVFHEELKNFLLSPDEIAGYLAQADHTLQDKEALLRTLMDEQDRLKREMDKVYRAYVADEIPMDAYGRQYRPLEERLRALENEIPSLQGEIDFLRIQGLSRDEVLTEARDLWARWPDLTTAEKRQIIENITESIVVGKNDVTINLCHLPFPPPPSPELATTKQRNLRGSSPRPASPSPAA